MNNRIIGAMSVLFGADPSQFEAGLASMSTSLQRWGKDMEKIGKKLSMNITAPLSVAGFGVLNFASNFEQAMADVAAAALPTSDEFSKLSDKARELGRTSKFSASQVASGMEMLAKNGLTVTQILNGATDATVNLAAAADAQLAPAGDVVTAVMVNFRKEGTALAGVVDNIAGTLNLSKLGWEDYEAAVGQAAGVAGPLGMSFEDMNAALAATSASFSSGEEAGTSLKGMLLNLAPSSKQAKDLIQQLGLEFFDAAGNIRPLAEIAEELRVKLGDLTKESQAEVFGALFGQRTIRTAFRLMEEGAAGIERFKEAIANVSAAEVAQKRLNTWIGDWTKFKGAIESVSIAIGNSGFLEWARGVTQGATAMINSLAMVNPSVLRFGTIVAGLAAMIGPALIALGILAASIGAIGIPVAATIAGVAILASALAAFWPTIVQTAKFVGNAVVGIAQGFGTLIDKVQQVNVIIWNVMESIFGAAKKWLVDSLSPLFDTVRGIIDKLSGAFKSLVESSGLGTLLSWVSKAFNDATSEAVSGGGQLAGAVTGAVNDTVAAGGAAVAQAGANILSHWQAAGVQVAAAAPAIADQLAWPATLAAEKINQAMSGTRVFSATDGEDTEKALDEKIKNQMDGLLAIGEEGIRITEEMQTPAEALATKMASLDQLFQRNAISQQTYARAQTAASEEAGTSWDTAGASIAGSFAEIGQAFGNESKSMAKMAKAAGIVQATISMFTGAAKALELPWPANLAAMAAVMAQGASIVASIKSTKVPGFATGGSFKVGGAGGVDSQLMQFRATPGEMVEIKRPGEAGGDRSGVIDLRVTLDDFMTGKFIRNLFDRMNEELGDGSRFQIVGIQGGR